MNGRISREFILIYFINMFILDFYGHLKAAALENTKWTVSVR